MKNISAIIFIVFAVALFFLYIKPEWQTVQTLQAQKATYDTGLTQARQSQTLRDSLVSQFNNISDTDKAKLAAIVPSTFDSAKFASDISSRAVTYGLQFQGLTVSGVNDATQQASAVRSITGITPQTAAVLYQTHIVTFNVTGTYGNFVSFLKDIESDVELIDVDKIDIGAGSQTGVNVGLNFKVEAKTYSLN